MLGVAVVASIAFTGWLVISTVRVRFERDVARIVFTDNSEALERAERAVQAVTDSAGIVASASNRALASTQPVIVVSIEERRLWYKVGDSVVLTVPVATGSGRRLEVQGGTRVLRFDTPRGRFVVQRRDSAPAWVPPEWHFVEQANKRKLGLVRLERGVPIALKNGGEILVIGNDVVRRSSDGQITAFTVTEGHEIIADGRIVVPPFGTNQRRYEGVLGAYRLYLGDGYGIHGTNEPSSIGRAVSHGCIRLRNEDITLLYQMVALGTPVFIY